jgi:hypothetical protein
MYFLHLKKYEYEKKLIENQLQDQRAHGQLKTLEEVIKAIEVRMCSV